MITWERLKKLLTHTECDNCGGRVKVLAAKTDPIGRITPTQLEFGANWFLGGGYAEFIDTMHDDDHQVFLCHDCVVKVFEALPGVARKFGKQTIGWHPYEGTPCCRWGWGQYTDEQERP